MTTFQGNLCGIAALVMWSSSIALMRSVTEAFGVDAGTALIYTIAAAALYLREGRLEWRGLPVVYAWGSGIFFVLYGVLFSQAVGLAINHRQTLEVGMINYLWPCLIIVLSLWINKKKLSWLVWPGVVISSAGIFWCLAAGSEVTLAGFWSNILTTPIPYVFSLTAAFSWGLYCNLSTRYGQGHNAVPLFFMVVAVILWVNFLFRGEFLHFPGLWPLCELALMGVIHGVSYSLWETGLHKGNMVLMAVLSYFTPAASMLFICIWLKTLPPTDFWPGVGWVIAGSRLWWLASRRA